MLKLTQVGHGAPDLDPKPMKIEKVQPGTANCGEKKCDRAQRRRRKKTAAWQTRGAKKKSLRSYPGFRPRLQSFKDGITLVSSDSVDPNALA
jgi:hypothetical protein